MNTLSSEQQPTQSCLVHVDSKGSLQWISPNSNPIQIYSTELWEILTEKGTIATYKQALIKTWRILKYLLLILLLAALFGIALIFSFWGIGYNLGVSLQQWIANSDPDQQSQEFFQGLQKILLWPFRKAVEWANKYIKFYLPGWKSSNIKLSEPSENEED